MMGSSMRWIGEVLASVRGVLSAEVVEALGMGGWVAVADPSVYLGGKPPLDTQWHRAIEVVG